MFQPLVSFNYIRQGSLYAFVYLITNQINHQSSSSRHRPYNGLLQRCFLNTYNKIFYHFFLSSFKYLTVATTVFKIFLKQLVFSYGNYLKKI